jgi:hypothetical protein
MSLIRIAVALLLSSISCFAQGQVVFANKVGKDVDAPVSVFIPGPIIPGAGYEIGPGPYYSVGLWLQGENGSLTLLTPISTFHEAGLGPNAIADRYWFSKTVDVPVEPGTKATFIVRTWLTSVGSYEDALGRGGGFAQSDPFVVTVGGGLFPPSNLTTLRPFHIIAIPEPSVIMITALGATALCLGRKKSQGSPDSSPSSINPKE